MFSAMRPRNSRAEISRPKAMPRRTPPPIHPAGPPGRIRGCAAKCSGEPGQRVSREQYVVQPRSHVPQRRGRPPTAERVPHSPMRGEGGRPVHPLLASHSDAIPGKRLSHVDSREATGQGHTEPAHVVTDLQVRAQAGAKVSHGREYFRAALIRFRMHQKERAVDAESLCLAEKRDEAQRRNRERNDITALHGSQWMARILTLPRRFGCRGCRMTTSTSTPSLMSIPTSRFAENACT